MFLELFKGDPYKVYTRPPIQLGKYVVIDGEVWRMCYANEDLLFGEVVRDAPNLVNAGTVSAASAAGTNTLNDTGVFTSAREVYVGAWGQTLGTHANGGGQIFTVREKASDNALTVSVRFSNTSGGVASRVTDGNWAYALNTSSTYDLYRPGAVEDAVYGIPPVGVAQVIVDASVAPYFFAKVSGIACVLCQDSDSDIIEGEWVSVSTSTNGHIEGVNATGAPAIQDISGRVGIALADEISYGQGIAVDLVLPMVASSPWKPRTTHPFNDVTV